MVDNRGEQRLLRICDNRYSRCHSRKFKWRKIAVDLNELLKHPYGTTFEVVNGELKPIEANEVESDEPEEEGEPEKADNREIFT